MPFETIADPEQVGMMRSALDRYCSANGIEIGTPEHAAVAQRIIFLVSTGIGEPGQIDEQIAPEPTALPEQVALS